jgi:hypothetical protein
MEESGTILASFLSVVVLPVPALASIIKSLGELKESITVLNRSTLDVFQGSFTEIVSFSPEVHSS